MCEMCEATKKSFVAKHLFDLKVAEHKIVLLSGDREKANRLRDEALSLFYQMISSNEQEVLALTEKLKKRRD